MLIEHRLNYDCAVIELRLSNVWANLELSSKPKLNNLVLVELTPNVQHTQYQQIHQQLEQLKAGSIKVHETQAVTELSKQKIQWLGTRSARISGSTSTIRTLGTLQYMAHRKKYLQVCFRMCSVRPRCALHLHFSFPNSN